MITRDTMLMSIFVIRDTLLSFFLKENRLELFPAKSIRVQI